MSQHDDKHRKNKKIVVIEKVRDKYGSVIVFGLRRPCPLGRGGSKPSSFHRLI